MRGRRDGQGGGAQDVWETLDIWVQPSERMEGEGKVVGMGWGGTAAVTSYLMRRYREDKVRLISASCSRTRANGHKLQQEKLTSSSPL